MIRVWDLASRTTLHVIQVHLGIVSGLHLVRGRFIVSSSEVDAAESEVNLLDLDTGELITSLPGLTGRISCCSTDDRRVVAASPTQVGIWEMW